MTSKPSIVFVPGAWHAPHYWDKVIAYLTQQGYSCSTVTLPSTLENPDSGLLEDITAARAVITKETAKGQDVVVVAHSYGGAVGASAIKGLSKTPDLHSDDGDSRPRTSSATNVEKNATTQGHVVSFVLVASGLVRTGLSFIGHVPGGTPPPQWRVNLETGFAEITLDAEGIREFFYHDLSEDEGRFWVSQLKPHALRSVTEGGEHMYSGWKDVPCWMLVCTEDRAMPMELLRMMVKNGQDEGAAITLREASSSHSPMLSIPDVVSGLIVEAAQEARSSS
ncbi:prolyl aminopeptidase-like protein [Microdochium trichocladiopsis]|uniref:Prolyl aminopeptidase-like protein n=1 Tax=Microdochium trichocladiopsis TaxID=1682393 RepID=A0A9P8Y7W9_9PEZI|nr:prolyl aminopeptidase-like protein [Microdochium trichocladiopsis]KAH7032762.1 prolyl aminopeptidase-like protein [Microdochium trichocladiopsis]